MHRADARGASRGDGRDDAIDVEDHTGTLARWFARAEVRSGGVLLLWPDRFVFGVTAPGRGGSSIDEFRLRLGTFAHAAGLPFEQ
ncbi:hypothetical protein [Nocardia niwae]|uniref:hypothetical protein n=1 Tax=Nocardia niwae TaxID=626084 RepID=UPI0033EF039B